MRHDALIKDKDTYYFIIKKKLRAKLYKPTIDTMSVVHRKIMLPGTLSYFWENNIRVLVSFVWICLFNRINYFWDIFVSKIVYYFTGSTPLRVRKEYLSSRCYSGGYMVLSS